VLHLEVCGQQALANRGVEADELPLVAGQAAGAREHRSRNCDVADVAQVADGLELVQLVARHSQPPPDPCRERRDVVSRSHEPPSVDRLLDRPQVVVACGVAPAMGAPDRKLDRLLGRMRFAAEHRVSSRARDRESFADLGQGLRCDGAKLGGQ